MRYLPIVALLFLALPAAAQPAPSRAQVNAHIAALCDADPACMARVRARLQARCGSDRACVVDALRRARERRDAQDPSLSDLPQPLQDLVRELLELADGTASDAPEPALGDAARDRLDALPPALQERIRQRCGTDPDCIRRALREAQARRGENGTQEPEPEESEPEVSEPEPSEAPTDEASGSDESGEAPRFSLPLDTPLGRGLPNDRGTGSTSDDPDRNRELRQDLRNRTETPPGRGLPDTGAPLGGSGSGSSGSVATPNPPDGPIRHDAVGTTLISGNSDDRVRTLTAPDGAWLIAIRMAERSDDPCFVQAFYTDEDYVTGPNGDESIGDTYLEFDQCGDDGPTLASRKLISMGIENNPPLIGGEPYAFNGDGDLVGITTLQVCQRSSNDLVKGFSITGVTLDLDRTPVGTSRYTEEVAVPPTPAQVAQGQSSPQVVTRPVTHGFERPNCNDWKAERSCSDGKVAIGLEIHYDKRTSGRSQITGLALKCAKLDR